MGKVCDTCRGAKRVAQSDTFKVRVKPGTKTGDHITVREAGDHHPDADPGDLIVHVVVAPHRLFTRDGNDLHMEVVVSLTEVGGAVRCGVVWCGAVWCG